MKHGLNERMVGRLLAVVFVGGVCVAAMSASAAAFRARQDLPEGQGRAATQRLCNNECHGIDKFIAEHRSKSQWVETIDIMKHDGAKGTDEDFKAALSYLVAHFGIKVKINTATARQIDDVLVLEPGQAESIVKYRDDHGPFADWQGLMKVPGLDPKKLEEQKANVVF